MIIARRGAWWRVRPFAVVVGLAALLVACGGSAIEEEAGNEQQSGGVGADEEASAGAGDDTFKVGLINPLTGPFAALGEDVNDGFQYYLDQHDGQLAGYTIETRQEDTANDGAVATERAQQLVERFGAEALVGFVNSGVTYAASSYIGESGVPLIITTAGADGLTQDDRAPNFFRVSYTSSQDAMPLGPYACNDLGLKSATVVALDYAFGWEASGGFSRAYEDAGCDVTQEIYVPLDTQDWAPFLQDIDTDSDAVWAVIAGPDAVRFMRSYRDFGADLPLLGHGSLTDGQVLAQQQQTAEDTVTTLHYSEPLDTPLNNEFRAGFEEAYGRSVSQYAEHGYTAAQVLEAALEAVDRPTPDALNEAILDVELDAPRGPLEFDEYGQAVYNVYVRKVEQADGTWQNTVVDTIEDVSQFWDYDPEEYLEFDPYEDLKGTWSKD